MIDIAQYRKIIQPAEESREAKELDYLEAVYSQIAANEAMIDQLNSDRKQISQFDVIRLNKHDSKIRDIEKETADLDGQTKRLESRLRNIFKAARADYQARSFLRHQLGDHLVETA